jgi:nicotinamidase-related amidase
MVDESQVTVSEVIADRGATTAGTDMLQFYRSRGFGGRVGFGSQPAILVIDFARAWLDTTSPLGADLQKEVAQTRRLLDVARKRIVPVFFTTTAFEPDLRDRGSVINKKRPGREFLAKGSEWVEVSPELDMRADEVLIVKQRASAFFGTTLLSQLVAHRVDTVILTGCSTSGCVRETASAAHDQNLHVIVVEEAVGDRSRRCHESSLFDIDRSLGDVVGIDEVIAHLEGFSVRPDTPPSTTTVQPAPHP